MGLTIRKITYVIVITIIIDKKVIKNPDVWYDIITAVIDPGPANNGKAIGTTPISSLTLLTNLHSPYVNNSIAIINNNVPPAIMKLNIVIPNNPKIWVPATPKRSNNAAAVIIAVLDTVLCAAFSNFFVNAMNKGMLPMGSITTNNAMTDVIISFWKVSYMLSKSLRVWKTDINSSVNNM